jgi:hypothetical protein
MRLILWISSPTPDVERTHTFGEEGGTIGRGADNSWILRHPKVSGQHAVISFSDGQFFIEDTSDLGVLVNYVREIGPRPYALKSGDRLFIEPYEIEVELDTEDECASLDSEHDPFALPSDPGAELREPAPPSSEAGELDPLVFLKPEAGSPKPSPPATRPVDDLLSKHYAPPTSVPPSPSSSGELDVEPIPAGYSPLDDEPCGPSISSPPPMEDALRRHEDEQRRRAEAERQRREEKERTRYQAEAQRQRSQEEERRRSEAEARARAQEEARREAEEQSRREREVAESAERARLEERRRQEEIERARREQEECRRRAEAEQRASEISSLPGSATDILSEPTVIVPSRRKPLDDTGVFPPAHSVPKRTIPAPPSNPSLMSRLAGVVRGLGRWLQSERAPKDTAARRSPAPGATEADEVKCSVFAPPRASAGDAVLIQVFAHLPSEARRVAEVAQAFDHRALGRAMRFLERPVGRGTELTFSLSLPGIPADEPTQSLVWRGSADSVLFTVTIPRDHRGGRLIGTVLVSQNSVPFGHLKFILDVVTQDAVAGSAEGSPGRQTWRRYQHAFISYASEDRAEVLKRTQMLKLVSIDFFQDLLSIEPGERWAKSLYKNIDKSDVFFLFWSTAAKNSEWVMKEVRYAIERHGGDDLAPPEIVPVLIEGPPPVAPPPELKDLHFNDRFLYFIAGS